MRIHQTLFDRIRGEYREMPGLRLTARQACRLWQLDARTCEVVLVTLLHDGFLHQMHDGSYVAYPDGHPTNGRIIRVPW